MEKTLEEQLAIVQEWKAKAVDMKMYDLAAHLRDKSIQIQLSTTERYLKQAMKNGGIEDTEYNKC